MYWICLYWFLSNISDLCISVHNMFSLYRHPPNMICKGMDAIPIAKPDASDDLVPFAIFDKFAIPFFKLLFFELVTSFWKFSNNFLNSQSDYPDIPLSNYFSQNYMTMDYLFFVFFSTSHFLLSTLTSPVSTSTGSHAQLPAREFLWNDPQPFNNQYSQVKLIIFLPKYSILASSTTIPSNLSETLKF